MDVWSNIIVIAICVIAAICILKALKGLLKLGAIVAVAFILYKYVISGFLM